MDEHDVVEAGTDLLFGDPKSVLKKIGLSILDKKGAFLIAKSSEKICGYLGISKFTLYKYLDAIRTEEK